MYSGDEFYGDDVTSPLVRPVAPRPTIDLPGRAEPLAADTGRVCFRQSFNDEGAWRYFATHGEARRAARSWKAWNICGIVNVQALCVDGWW